MKSYTDCHDCIYEKERKELPDICKSEEAMKYFNPESEILFCGDINPYHDCKFVKLKLVPSIRELFSDNN